MDEPLPILLCVAAPAECDRILGAFGIVGSTTHGSRTTVRAGEANKPAVELLATGVGPTAAGVSAAASLVERSASAVISIGVAGAYPGSGVRLLQTVCSTRSIIAGEGRAESASFVGLAAMGFGPFDGKEQAGVSPELAGHLGRLCDHTGPVACVAAVSGTDVLAEAVETRTGACAEAMEGAAVHLACHRVGVPFAEVRVISNIVGDRDRHPWKLTEAFDRLGPLAHAVVDALSV